MAGHSEGIKVDQFCAERKNKCDCGNEYQKNCTPAPVGWATYVFWQGTKIGVEKRHEAHHLLCVACVTEFIGKEPKIQPVVEQTKWCVNDKPNLFAMPLWGHTIKWYCDLASAGALKTNPIPPPFANIPQHDYDHNSSEGFTAEVGDALSKLAEQIEEKADESHEAAVQELKSQLDAKSGHYRGQLQTRGSTRCGGTHNAWLKGMKDPESDWYLPFSMAKDGSVEARTFPAPGFDGKVADKIKRLVQALGKWGGT